MDKVNVRYIVADVDAAIKFYTDALGFHVDMHPAPGFAALSKGALQLFLNKPGAGGAGQAMDDGRTPAPGGWNRFQVEVEDLAVTVTKLKDSGHRFRNAEAEQHAARRQPRHRHGADYMRNESPEIAARPAGFSDEKFNGLPRRVILAHSCQISRHTDGVAMDQRASNTRVLHFYAVADEHVRCVIADVVTHVGEPSDAPEIHEVA